MYASDWIFALFSNVIPTSKMDLFFDGFFKDGWIFFYKFTMTLLRILQPKILSIDDFADIINIIKDPMDSKSPHKISSEPPEESKDFKEIRSPDRIGERRTFLGSIGTFFWRS